MVRQSPSLCSSKFDLQTGTGARCCGELGLSVPLLCPQYSNPRIHHSPTTEAVGEGAFQVEEQGGFDLHKVGPVTARPGLLFPALVEEG